MFKGFEILKNAILKGELNYFSAAQERPGVDFKIVASARWYENRGFPEWRIKSEASEPEGAEYEVICTELDGTINDPDYV